MNTKKKNTSTIRKTSIKNRTSGKSKRKKNLVKTKEAHTMTSQISTEIKLLDYMTTACYVHSINVSTFLDILNISKGYNKMSLNILERLKPIFKNKTGSISLTPDKISHGVDILYPYLNVSNKLLIITSYFTIAHELPKYYPDMKADIHFMRHEDYDIDTSFNPRVEKVKSMKYYHVSSSPMSLYQSNQKYDHIITAHHNFAYPFVVFGYLRIKLPENILFIVSALLNLKKNGNLDIFMIAGSSYPAINKILTLLCHSFKKISIQSTREMYTLLQCSGYLDNISSYQMSKLIQVATDIYRNKLNYSINHFLNYYCYQQKNNKHFGYTLDTKISNSPIHVKYQKMPILYDIDINVKNTPISQFIIYQFQQIYQSYIENMETNTVRYANMIHQGEDVSDFIAKLKYHHMKQLVDIYQKYNYPFNKSYLVYVNQYDKNLLNQIYLPGKQINQAIVNYTGKNKVTEKLSLSQKNYTYPDTYNFHKLTQLSQLTNHKLLSELPSKKQVSKILSEYSQDIAKYINQTYMLDFPINDEYLVLWEILNQYPNIVPNQDIIKAFHFTSPSIQWVHALGNFLDLKKNKVHHYKWLASIKKTKTRKIVDDNNLYQTYQHRFTDYTNDIQDICQNIQDQNPDIILANMTYSDSDLKKNLQEEYQYMLSVIGGCSIGTNVIVKHRIPFSYAVDEDEDSESGFMVNLLYIYTVLFKNVRLIKPYCGSHTEGDYYVIGFGFKGIEDSLWKKLLDGLGSYHSFLKEKDISESFWRQILSFIQNTTHVRNDYIELQNTLLTCFLTNDEIIQREINCQKYINSRYINQINKKRFESWIKINNYSASWFQNWLKLNTIS